MHLFSTARKVVGPCGEQCLAKVDRAARRVLALQPASDLHQLHQLRQLWRSRDMLWEAYLSK